MRRLTLEHYVSLTTTLDLVASLSDGVEAYDYLHRGGEADLVIMDLHSAGLHPEDLRGPAATAAPRWLLIEQMGNVPLFNCESSHGRLAQPLCFSQFGKLVGQTMTAHETVAHQAA